MIKLLVLILLCASSIDMASAQVKKSDGWMSKSDIASFITENKDKLEVIYPVAKLYEFKDNNGEGVVILTE